jgi:hypothetical protein
MAIRAKEGADWRNFVYLRHLSKGAILRVGSRLKIHEQRAVAVTPRGRLFTKKAAIFPKTSKVENIFVAAEMRRCAVGRGAAASRAR